MAGHLEMIKNIIEHGYVQPDRTTVGCKKLFSQKMVFDMREGFPFYSIRPCPLRFAFEEYQAFLSGRTDIHNVLTEKDMTDGRAYYLIQDKLWTKFHETLVLDGG